MYPSAQAAVAQQIVPGSNSPKNLKLFVFFWQLSCWRNERNELHPDNQMQTDWSLVTPGREIHLHVCVKYCWLRPLKHISAVRKLCDWSTTQNGVGFFPVVFDLLWKVSVSLTFVLRRCVYSDVFQWRRSSREGGTQPHVAMATALRLQRRTLKLNNKLKMKRNFRSFSSGFIFRTADCFPRLTSNCKLDFCYYSAAEQHTHTCSCLFRVSVNL